YQVVRFGGGVGELSGQGVRGGDVPFVQRAVRGVLTSPYGRDEFGVTVVAEPGRHRGHLLRSLLAMTPGTLSVCRTRMCAAHWPGVSRHRSDGVASPL